MKNSIKQTNTYFIIFITCSVMIASGLVLISKNVGDVILEEITNQIDIVRPYALSEDYLEKSSSSLNESKWRTCDVGTMKWACPQGWRSHEHGITNISDESKYGKVQYEEIFISAFGRPIDKDFDQSKTLSEIAWDEVNSLTSKGVACNETIETVDYIFIECKENNRGKDFAYTYYKVSVYISSENKKQFDIGTVTVETGRENFLESQSTVEEILSQTIIIGNQFRPLHSYSQDLNQ